MSEANKELVRRLFDEYINRNNMEVVDQLIAPDSVHRINHTPEVRGAKGYGQHVTAFRTGFPDLHFTIEDLIAEGERITIRFKITGTHTGEWAGIAPTGRPIAVTGTATCRIAGGKLVEELTDWDALGLWKQLGLVTDPVVAEANKAVVRRYVEEIVNRGKLALVDEIFTSDAVVRDSANLDFRGIEGVKQLIKAIRSALPDVHYDFIGEPVGEGDVVMFRWTMTGIQEGEWMGIAPTRKRLTLRGTSSLRIAGGKIAEQWTDYDSLGMFQQLGATPPLEQAKVTAAR